METYDVVRGDLGSLRTSGGNFTPATDECVANDVESDNIDYDLDPALGQGDWFLIRRGSDTYDTCGIAQVGNRDGEIVFSGQDCP